MKTEAKKNYGEIQALVSAATQTLEKGAEMKDFNEDAKAYVEKNKVKRETFGLDLKDPSQLRAFIMTLKRRCVDGRYEQKDASDSFAFPGADFQVIMSLIKIGFSADEAKRLTFKAIQNLHALYNPILREKGVPVDKILEPTLYFHDDSHADHDPNACGCGHVKLGATDEVYGITPQQGEEMKAFYRDIKAKTHLGPVTDEAEHIRYDKSVLRGDHAEKGVILNASVEWSIPSQDGHNSYFIYDSLLVDTYMTMLYEQFSQMNILNGDQTLDSFINASHVQRDETVKKLNKSGEAIAVKIEEDGKLVV